MENGWIFQLKTIKRHFYSQLEAFQPCKVCLPADQLDGKQNNLLTCLTAVGLLTALTTGTDQFGPVRETETHSRDYLLIL